MEEEYKILELLKENPMLMTELQKELEFTTNGIVGVMAFLEKYELVETMASVNHGLMAKITTRGLQLLNLPKLPEDETTGEEITELTLIEQKMADKTINLYSLSQHTETANWIDAMVMRFNVSGNDVIRVMWVIAKDTVGAKLERDVKEKKKRK